MYVAWTECIHRTYCVIPLVMELFNPLTLYTPIRKFPAVFRCPSSKSGGPYQHISAIYSADCTFVSTSDVEWSRPWGVLTCCMCASCYLQFGVPSYQKIRLSWAWCTCLGNINSFGLTKKKNDATTKSTGPSAGYFECFVSKQEMIHVADWSSIVTWGSEFEAG